MPVMVVRVAKVTEHDLRSGGRRFEVWPVVGDGPMVSTFSPFKAALCERAAVTGRTVEIGWKDGRYGNDLVTVRLLPQDSEQVA